MKATIIKHSDSKNLDTYLSDLKQGFDFYERHTEGDIKDRASGYKRIIDMIQRVLNEGTENYHHFVAFKLVSGENICIDALKVKMIKPGASFYRLFVENEYVDISYRGSMVDLVSIIEAAR